MIRIITNPSRLCDSWSRRELLTVGGLSLFGLGLPTLFRRHAVQADDRPPSGASVTASRGSKAGSGFGAAESVIVVYLQGSPSHIDLWDPKPDAPAEIRGEFKPIATTAPGMLLGEVLPLLAQQAHRFSLVRSIGVDPKGLRNHGAAIYMLMTGHDPTNFTPTGLAVPPSRDDLPSVGAVIARYRPSAAGRLSNVAICGPVKEGKEIGVGQSAGLLGPSYDPFAMYSDPTQPLQLDALRLAGDMPIERLQSRIDLRRALLDAQLQQALTKPGEFTAHAAGRALDSHYERALSLVMSNKAVHAFQMDEESAVTRERYGMTRFGQSCLLARRLVEAGTRFVQVTWPARSDDEPMAGPDGSWDTHRNNFPMLRDHRCPVFDRSMSALIADLSERGLLDSTLVVAIGEFGRSPKIGAPTTDNVGPGGRDHWPECYSFLIAGGGVLPGQVYGESDRHGGWPKVDAVHPYDLLATLHHALGIDPTTEYRDSLNRPRRLVERGRPILGLFG